jgi:hypothetical protein
MPTLSSILDQIRAKPGFLRIIEARHEHANNNLDRIIEYNIFYTDLSGNVAIAYMKVYVSNFSLATESAEVIGPIPALATAPVENAFLTALKTKIAAIKAANTKIKRIVITNLDIANTFAVVVAYIADNAANPAMITKTQYFAYDNFGTIVYYPYTGAVG